MCIEADAMVFCQVKRVTCSMRLISYSLRIYCEPEIQNDYVIDRVFN